MGNFLFEFGATIPNMAIFFRFHIYIVFHILILRSLIVALVHFLCHLLNLM